MDWQENLIARLWYLLELLQPKAMSRNFPRPTIAAGPREDDEDASFLPPRVLAPVQYMHPQPQQHHQNIRYHPYNMPLHFPQPGHNPNVVVPPPGNLMYFQPGQLGLAQHLQPPYHAVPGLDPNVRYIPAPNVQVVTLSTYVRIS